MLSNHNELFHHVGSEEYRKAEARHDCLQPFLNIPKHHYNAAHVACIVAHGTSYQHSIRN